MNLFGAAMYLITPTPLSLSKHKLYPAKEWDGFQGLCHKFVSKTMVSNMCYATQQVQRAVIVVL